jgi:hypothetical protein
LSVRFTSFQILFAAQQRKRYFLHEKYATPYEGRDLEYRQFDKLTHTHQGEVVPHKRLGAMLSMLSQQQKLLPLEKRSVKCPTRRYPPPARLS